MKAASLTRFIPFVLLFVAVGSVRGESGGLFAPNPSSFRGQPTLFTWSGSEENEGGPPSRDEPLASDRPDFTEASTTVGRGVIQLETGYTFIRDKSGGTATDTHSFPETLFRVGMFADWFEFRFAYNHGVQKLAPVGLPVSTASGGEDIYLGAKIGLTGQRGILPEMAIMPQMTVPTGHNGVTGSEALPGINWLYGWDINDWLSTGGSSQVNKGTDDDGTNYYEYAQSWTVCFALTERVGMYTEFFALMPSGASAAKPEYYFDGGFTFSVTNDLQLDVRSGSGINGAADDYFIGSGAVIRF